jgi:hypothetical protein
VSDEVSSVFNFLHLEQFASCPEFAFEPCYWRFVPFVERERDMFSGNTEIAHRSFDAHKEHFSAGIERLLFADQQARAFGLRFLPDSGPNVVRSKIVSAPAASAGKTPSGTGYEYDVAVSFAGTERALAEKLATATREAGFNVFYDGFYPEQLWGKDLASFFDSVYRKASHFCVMFISSEYRDRMWTTHERRSAMARAIEEKGNEYILPIEVKKVDIDGLVPTIGHLSLSDHTIDRISEILIKKLKSSGK